MTRMQKLVGGSFLSLILISLVFFSRCGIQMQRVNSEADFVPLSMEDADSSSEWIEPLDDESAETEDSVTDLLSQLQSADNPNPMQDSEQTIFPQDSMNRLRAIVSEEMQDTPPTAPGESQDEQRIETMLAQLESAENEPQVRKTADITNMPVSTDAVAPTIAPAPSMASDEVIATESVTVDRTGPQPAPAAPSAIEPEPVTFEMLYRDALDFYYARRYSQAIRKFRQLLLRNDAGDLADNCQYWIGECYYAMGDYYQAIVEFEKVNRYADANKLADAQLMAGVAMMKIGQKRQARTELSLLATLFKKAPILKKVKHYLSLLERV